MMTQRARALGEVVDGKLMVTDQQGTNGDSGGDCLGSWRYCSVVLLVFRLTIVAERA